MSRSVELLDALIGFLGAAESRRDIPLLQMMVDEALLHMRLVRSLRRAA